MAQFVRLVIVPVLLGLVLAATPAAADGPQGDSCLYPVPSERFGITVGGRLDGWDISSLAAGSYHNWSVNPFPSNVQGLRYYPVIHVTEKGYTPNRDALSRLVATHRGATWLVGNEMDTVWMGDSRPETYVKYYHEIYHTIKSLDPAAKVGFNGFATVSTLRLAWLDQAWASYRALYGTDIPVDVWNIHTYVVNEMVHEWGPQIPPGIENAVGYTDDLWQLVAMPAASGGTVHATNTPGARAYFAVHGDSVTIYLHTGPDAGMADIYIDNRAMPPDPPKPARPVERIDLYSPQPGVISRTYRDLPPGDRRLDDWHHVRVEVLWTRNPASTGTWVRVDAAEAASTAGLPTGRLEDDNPLRARIIPTTDTYLDVDEVLAQLRMFRRWMLEHGQRDKPLINSEFGMLLGEEQGVRYPETREFMLRSFDMFMNEAIDAELGYPADGNRLLQEWFWFILAGDTFNGTRVYTGLFDLATRSILPLGQDFAAYVRPLARQYADLEVTYAQGTVTWPLFAGQPARFQLDAGIGNRGQLPVGSFHVTLTDGAQIVKDWVVPGLAGREGANTFALDHAWEKNVVGSRTLTLTLDSAGQVDEPCDPNNKSTFVLTGPAHTDVAIASATAQIERLPRPGGTADIVVDISLINKGSKGTEAAAIPVSLWRVDANGNQTLLDRQQILRTTPTATRVRLRWRGASAGDYSLKVKLDSVPGDANTGNNQVSLQLMVPAVVLYFPIGAVD